MWMVQSAAGQHAQEFIEKTVGRDLLEWPSNLAEFPLRYNNRENADTFGMAIR